MGHSDSARRGQRPRDLKNELALDLVGISHGSPATKLMLDRARPQMSIPDADFGMDVFEKSIQGLDAVQRNGAGLPVGFDRGVLSAWRDFGKLLDRGVSDIQISLNGRPSPLVTHYTPDGYRRLQERIVGHEVNVRTVEGRLLMADFKEHGTRCRIHPSVGDPILCLFDDEQKDEVLENILQYVQVVGEAIEDPLSNKITSIRIADIQRVEDQDAAADGLVPVGTPIPTDFWTSPSIEDLANSQGVRPLGDVRVLFGTWPGTEDDGFEEAIRELRQIDGDGGT